MPFSDGTPFGGVSQDDFRQRPENFGDFKETGLRKRILVVDDEEMVLSNDELVQDPNTNRLVRKERVYAEYDDEGRVVRRGDRVDKSWTDKKIPKDRVLV